MPEKSFKNVGLLSNSFYEQELYPEEPWYSGTEADFYCNSGLFKELLSVADIPIDENSLNKAQTASLWCYFRTAFPGVSKKAYWENKHLEKKILKNITDKVHALQKLLTELSHNDNLMKIFDCPLLNRTQKINDEFYDACFEIQKKGSATENLDNFVFETALLYEYLSGKIYTSSNSAENNALITKGEKFSEVAVKIICEMIECFYMSMSYSYEEAGYGSSEEFIESNRAYVLSTQIKTSCVRARDKLNKMRS